MRIIAIVLLFVSSVAVAQETRLTPTPFVISSQDNLVRLSSDQLLQLGFTQRTAEDGHTFWSRSVKMMSCSSGGCGSSTLAPSGSCANGSCGSSSQRPSPRQLAPTGWNAAPRGDKPGLNPTQAPAPIQAPPTPSHTAKGEKGDKGDKGDPGDPGKGLTDEDKQQMLLAIYKMVQADPAMKGPKGDPGTPADLDALADAVIAKLPAFVIQFTNKDGQVVEELPFQFDPKTNSMLAKFKPIPIESYNVDGTLKDREWYPYTWPIRLKPIVIPPQNKGA